MNIYQLMWMSKDYDSVSAIGVADDWEKLVKYVKKIYRPLNRCVIVLDGTETNLERAKKEGRLIIEL